MRESASSPAPLAAAPRARLRTLFVGAMLAAAALPAAADVTIFVEAASNAGGEGKTAENVGNESPRGGAIHGVAEATRDGSSAFVANGDAGGCDFIAGVGCAYTLPQSRATGEIRGDLGRLRGAIYASADESAGVGLGVAGLNLGLIDVIRTTALGDLRFNLHFDVDNLVVGSPSTLLENTFELHLMLQPLVPGATATTFGFTLPEFEGGHTEIDRDFAFAALPNATQVVVRLDIVGRNECATNASEPGGSLCNIWTNAGNTAYLGVEGDYVSVSGYAYPGFALAAPVPEPETAALLLAGLVALATLRRRTARR